MMLWEIRQYQKRNGEIPFKEWLLGLNDSQTRARVRARLDRLRLGNFGDSKSVGSGIFELRFHLGPGYRVYYGLRQGRIVILLSGGDKSAQASDIRKANVYWQDYLERET